MLEANMWRNYFYFFLNNEKRVNLFTPSFFFFYAVITLCKILALCCPTQCLFFSVSEGIAHHIKREHIGKIQLFPLFSKKSCYARSSLKIHLSHSMKHLYGLCFHISQSQCFPRCNCDTRRYYCPCYSEGKGKYKVPTWIGKITKRGLWGSRKLNISLVA